MVLAPTHIVDGDNAEFSAVGAIGGRPHPSGYPAYVLYLRAMSWIPGSTPAHTAALATAVLGAAVVLVLHAACRAWGAKLLGASLACAIYAASPVVLRMHTQAEVFAMNALVVSLVPWSSAAKGPLTGIRRAACLGLVAGFGLGNHLTCVLISPVGILGVVRGIREARGQRALAIVVAIVGLAIGLSSYAYLVIADGPVSFGRVDGIGDVLDFFLRMDYGGPGAFVPTGHVVTASTNLGVLASTIGRWLWLPAFAGLVMVAYRIARPGATESRWAWALLAVSFLIAGPLLVLRFNIDPAGLGTYVIQRFHLLPVLLLAIPVALVDEASAQVGRLLQNDRLRSAALGGVLAASVFVVLVATSLSWLRAVHSPAMEKGIRNLLRSLPPDAVLVVNQEDLCFGGDYVQHATQEWLDVEIACWVVTSRQWYIDRLARRGVPFVDPFSVQITKPQALTILEHRPLFVDRSMTEIVRQLPSYPYGTMVRLLRPADRPPPLSEVVAMNRKLYEQFDLDYPRPSVDDDYAAIAHRRYAATWRLLATALESVGDTAGAADARELAIQIGPSRP